MQWFEHKYTCSWGLDLYFLIPASFHWVMLQFWRNCVIIIAAYKLFLNNILYIQGCFDWYTLKNTCWQESIGNPLNYTPISPHGKWQWGAAVSSSLMGLPYRAKCRSWDHTACWSLCMGAFEIRMSALIPRNHTLLLWKQMVKNSSVQNKQMQQMVLRLFHVSSACLWVNLIFHNPLKPVNGIYSGT